ncbi:hypothetical protein GCM10010278_57210 [Streptomyces melanogenes]|nr:hypothetical protein GCM10010278_57210 [Streptomyces melanogenes]
MRARQLGTLMTLAAFRRREGVGICRFYRGARRDLSSHHPNRDWPRRAAPVHTVRMLKHQTFVFTYGTGPSGCHGRAA